MTENEGNFFVRLEFYGYLRRSDRSRESKTLFTFYDKLYKLASSTNEAWRANDYWVFAVVW